MKIGAVLLAAGMSQRMGEENKMLLKIGNVSMFKYVLIQLINSSVDYIIVVLGHEVDELNNEVESLSSEKVKIVYNPLYANGLRSSLKSGFKKANTLKIQGLMVCLADMPFLLSEDYEIIYDAFKEKYGVHTPCILIPRFASIRGNPVVFSHHFFQEILDLSDQETDSGAREVIRRYKDHIEYLDMSNDHCLKDIDTKKDYQEWPRQ